LLPVRWDTPEFYGFQRFDDISATFLQHEIETMVQTQLKPKLILMRCIDLLTAKRIQIPNFNRLSALILSVINQRKKDLSILIEKELTAETRDLLDALFVQAPSVDATAEPSKTTRYKLTLLKKLSQSIKPSKVKERADDLFYMKELYKHLETILSSLKLGHEGIRYYANSVLKAKVFQLNQRSGEDRYIHLIAFIINA